MLSEISSRLYENFEIKDALRENLLKNSRNIVRLSGKAIKSIHRGEFNSAEQLLKEALNLNDRLKSVMTSHPDLYYTGFVENAQTEYAEASILYCITKEDRIPDTYEVGVEDSAYLLGLGDVVGELRRKILDLLRIDGFSESERLLEIMDEIYTTILLFDFPDALSRGLRHKCDTARSLVERTRGDLTNSLGNSRLKERMSSLEGKLDAKINDRHGG